MPSDQNFNEETFGSLLYELKERLNFTDVQLANAAGVRLVSSVSQWMNGSSMPTRFQFAKIITFVRTQARGQGHSMEDEISRLTELHPDPLIELADPFIEVDETTSKMAAFAMQKKALEQEIQELRAQKQNAPDEESRLAIGQAIRIVEQYRDRYPDVEISMPGKIKISLVRSDILNMMDDLHKDENRAWTVIGITVGAIFGMFINWLTSSDGMLPAALIVLAMFGIATAVAALWLSQIRNRIERYQEGELVSPGGNENADD